MRIYNAGERIAEINGESFYLVGKDLDTGKGFIVGRNTIIRDPKVNIKVNKNFDLLPTLVKYFLCEQLGTTDLTTDMTNLYKSFIGSEETNIVINFLELKAKEMTKWVIDSANTSAEKGLHRNTFNGLKIANDVETQLYIDIAADIYSMLWEIDKKVAIDTITKLSKTYSKGSFYTIKELGVDILQHAEKLLGYKPQIIESECKVKEIANYLFKRATEKYKEHIQHEEHAYAEYLVIENAIYPIVFHVWNGGSFTDTHNFIKETVKHFAKQEVSHTDEQFPYLEHYIHKTEGRKKCTQQQTKSFFGH